MEEDGEEGTGQWDYPGEDNSLLFTEEVQPHNEINVP